MLLKTNITSGINTHKFFYVILIIVKRRR